MYIPEFIILADDLTSATDGAAGFAQHGLSTKVLRPGWAMDDFADIVSIDTDSRTQPVTAAEARIQERRPLLSGARTIVKQFDSTLRGHVAAECYAALRTSNRRSLLVIAAFPSEGRTTVNGIQLLHGVPVEKTDFRFDPLNPVRTSSLPDLFATVTQSIRCARSVSEARDAVGEYEVVIVDAETEAQLDDAVAELREESDIVWAGSTGLLRALSRSFPSRSSGTTRTATDSAVRMSSTKPFDS
jgi:uncharacterized protein YgbK (DUF1537 family)